MSKENDAAHIHFYGNTGFNNVPVPDLQLAPPPTASSPVLTLIVPPDSKKPEDMTVDELREALYALGDRPELCEIIQYAETWRADQIFDGRDDRRILAGVLRYFRDKLMLGLGIAITPGDVTISEMGRAVMDDDSLVADALHDAGVDFGKYEFCNQDDGRTILSSFVIQACSIGKLGMVKRAISWGAYREASVIASAYNTISYKAKSASAILELLVDKCGLDVNFDPRLSENEDVTCLFKGYWYMSLLNFAVGFLEVEAAKVLLDRGAIVDCVKEIDHAIVDRVKEIDHANSDIFDFPLKTAVNTCCALSTPSDDRPKTFEMIDLLLRHGASLRLKASETAEESSRNNILSMSVMMGPSYDSSMNLAALTKLLHVGKPDASVVEEVIRLFPEIQIHCPVSIRLLSDYLHGKLICCDVCEKRTSEGGKPLKLCACRTISYCGKECQAVTWKEHKRVCGLKADGTTEALVKKREHRKKGGKK
jgi:hypothetical protein